jgi:hypothetical protein
MLKSKAVQMNRENLNINLELTEEEFNSLKSLANELDLTLEKTLEQIIKMSIKE